MPGIAESVALLSDAVREFVSGGTTSPGGVLSAVVAVNNAIGPALRLTRDAALFDLQVKVNEVTVRAKLRDRDGLGRAMEAVRAAAAALDGAPSA